MIRKIGTYFAANVYCGLLAVLIVPLMSRLLGPENLGRAIMFVTTVWILNTTVGLNIAATYAINRKQASPERMVGLTTSALTLVTINSLVAALLVTLLGDVLFGLTGLSRSILLLAVLGSYFNIFFLLLQSHQMIVGASKIYALQQMANATAVALLTVAFLTLSRPSLEGRVYALFLPYVGFGAWALYVMARGGLLRLRPRLAEAREVWSMGWRLMPHMGGVFLFAGMDRFIVTGLAGARAAGVYLGTVALTAAFSFVITAVNRAVVPILYDRIRDDPASARRFLLRMLAIALLVCAPAFALSFFVAPLIELVLGKGYGGSGALFPWLLLSQILFGLYTVGANVLMFYKRTLTLSAVTLSCGAAGIALMFAFYPVAGLAGFAYALVAAFALRCALTLWIGFALLRRRHDADLPEIDESEVIPS